MTICTEPMRAASAIVKNEYAYFLELRTNGDRTSMPLSTEEVTQDLGQLVEETYVQGVLADQLAVDAKHVTVEIVPAWSSEPMVERVNVTITCGSSGSQQRVSRSFENGPWGRLALQRVQAMRSEGVVPSEAQVYRLLLAVRRSEAANAEIAPPLLAPPPVVAECLDDLRIRHFGAGSFEPERPVLVSERLVADAITCCESAGPIETGGAVLGKIVRLPQPLPATSTRYVTLLSAILLDGRHAGETTQFHISPEALLEGTRIAEMRARNESVLTVFHTHGWGCGDCNAKACPLAECYPSLQDYDLEALFPTKALLLPIAGRKLGAAGRRPILQIHAWWGGELRPIRWQAYSD